MTTPDPALIALAECEPMEPDEDGWSEWIHPLPGYLMQCCDCSLIHEMEVCIGQVNEDCPAFNEGVVLFRMRRYVPEPHE